ncbi:MAG: ABC transporter ATP-binding protein [Acidobacteriota bacterium]|nr:ABC transporter ATP-binding protein [Acidobacteriota bacterium]
MADVAIRVDGVGKRYKIGGPTESYGSLRDTISRALARPFRRPSPKTHPGGDPRSFWALKNVSFELPQGRALGVIGTNGAGKSTLLKVLSRITEPTEGMAEIHGTVSSLLEVGSGFHGELTGRENVFLNGAILGMPKKEIVRKFDEIVSFAEVEKFIDTPVKHYSSGMYVRLAFAVAAHLEPEILIVDEVLAVGDAGFQRKCLGKMNSAAREGRTVLFVSHNMAAIENLCDAGLVLKNGQVIYSGDVDGAVQSYLKASFQGEFGSSDLTNHPGRERGMTPIVRSLELRGAESGDGPRDTIQTGTDIVFDIGFDTGARVLDYAFLAINSSFGERVCTVGTHISAFDGTFTGNGLLECRLPGLPLAAGEYAVTVAVGTHLPRRDVDRVENALRFRVETGNYFGSPEILLHGQGHLAQRSQWRVYDHEPVSALLDNP